LSVESSALEDNKSERRFYVLPVEDNFLTFFNIPLVAGRNFSQYNRERKGEDYVLNETAVRNLGWTPEEAIGKPFMINFNSPGIFYGGTITGVVKDFCFNTANQEIKPYVLFQKPIFYLNFLVKIYSSQKNEALAGLRKIWDEVYPDYPFEYESVEDIYKSAYRKEMTQAELTSLFSVLAVLIICFGLISFTAVTVVRRTKEIGIRKVNGAKLPDILVLLNANLIIRNIIAFSVACPVAWLVMDKWLQSYVYRTPVEWWIFLLSGISVLLITIATSTIQCWRAAVRNPVETLRYE
jgi:putative ABC transport system permease protein